MLVMAPSFIRPLMQMYATCPELHYQLSLRHTPTKVGIIIVLGKHASELEFSPE